MTKHGLYCDRPECQAKRRRRATRVGRNPSKPRSRIGVKTIKYAATSIDEWIERIKVTEGWDQHDKNVFEFRMLTRPEFIPKLEKDEEERRLYAPVRWACLGPRPTTKLIRVAIIAFQNENNTQIAARLRRLRVPPHLRLKLPHRQGRLRVSRSAVSRQRDKYRELGWKGPRARHAMRWVWDAGTLPTKLIRLAIIARPDLNDSQLGRFLGVFRERITQQRHKLPPNTRPDLNASQLEYVWKFLADFEQWLKNASNARTLAS
jgi:hypothetical protein